MNSLRNTAVWGNFKQIALLSVVALTIGGTAILDFLTPVGVVGGMLYGGPIYLTGFLSCAEETKRRLVLVVAGLCTILTVLAYFVSPQGGIPWMVISNHVIAILSMWIAAALALIHTRLVAENTELRELLPIVPTANKFAAMTAHGTNSKPTSIGMPALNSAMECAPLALRPTSMNWTKAHPT